MSEVAAVAAPRRHAPAEIPADPLDLLPADAVVAVAMSGGVDSSVAAARCVERGLATVGVTLAMWPRDAARDRDQGCCSVDAVEDARRVCATLGIPPTWDVTNRRWGLSPGARAIAGRNVDAYLWIGRPWLDNGQSAPFDYGRTLGLAASTPF